MPGNMGMNALARKIKLSLLLSSLPLFLPSLLHYRQMTGQSCRSSHRCFSSIRHHSITSCSLTCSSNKSLCLLMSLFISIRRVDFSSVALFLPYLQLTFVSSFLILFLLLQPSVFSVFARQRLPLSSPLEVMDSVLCFLFPFPLSSSLFPQVSNTRHNQSDAPSSLPPSIPKPLSPFCSPSSPRFPPVLPPLLLSTFASSSSNL